jgi:hypothetical protein
MVFSRSSLCLQLREVVVHPIEAGFPDGPVLLGPRRHFRQRAGVQGARPVLGELPPGHQAGPLEDLDVLRDRGQRQVERRREFVDGRLSLREARQDRPPSPVGQRGEGLVEPVLVVRCDR